MYKGPEKRTYEVEKKILNVLFDVIVGKFKLERQDNEECDVFALHRAIGGANYIWFNKFFRALRGLGTVLSKNGKSNITKLIDKLIYSAPFLSQHENHDRRTY